MFSTFSFLQPSLSLKYTTIICVSKVLPSYQQKGVGGHQDEDGQTISIDGPSWALSSQPELHTAKQGLQIMYLFCDWGR